MSRRRVLVGSTDESWVEELREKLEQGGYRVEVARLVSEVIRRARNGAVEVLIVGDELEGVRASELVSLVKGIEGGVQVIVVSTEESLGVVRRLRGAGIFYQAMKPVDMEELKSAVGCAFEKVERERAWEEGFFRVLTPSPVAA